MKNNLEIFDIKNQYKFQKMKKDFLNSEDKIIKQLASLPLSDQEVNLLKKNLLKRKNEIKAFEDALSSTYEKIAFLEKKRKKLELSLKKNRKNLEEKEILKIENDMKRLIDSYSKNSINLINFQNNYFNFLNNFIKINLNYYKRIKKITFQKKLLNLYKVIFNIAFFILIILTLLLDQKIFIKINSENSSTIKILILCFVAIYFVIRLTSFEDKETKAINNFNKKIKSQNFKKLIKK